MYRKKSKIVSNTENLGNYIEDFDIYNSLFLYKLSDQGLPREDYEITVYEFRPDLIARDYYGSTSYMGILLAQTKLTLTQFKKGLILHLLPKSIIDGIINTL